MSAVISSAKQFYRRALGVEALVLASVAAVVEVFSGQSVGLSVFSGSVAAFLPHCLFVYWVFFRNSVKNPQKMTAFYRGEGLKWLATILLIVLAFKFLPNLNYLAFFAGYFLGLVGNIALPMCVKHFVK